MNTRSESFERAFWQALDDMRDGAAQPIESYLRLVPSAERDELARMLSDLLLARGAAPTPSSGESEGYERALAAIDAVLDQGKRTGVLPQALLTMRKARGIDADSVVADLARDFEIHGEAGLKALERNYHSLETGKLLGAKISKRLFESLGRIFDIDARDLAAGAKMSIRPPGNQGMPLLGRASGSGRDRTRKTVDHGRLIDPEVEEVERLFRGGHDA